MTCLSFLVGIKEQFQTDLERLFRSRGSGAARLGLDARTKRRQNGQRTANFGRARRSAATCGRRASEASSLRARFNAERATRFAVGSRGPLGRFTAATALEACRS